MLGKKAKGFLGSMPMPKRGGGAADMPQTEMDDEMEQDEDKDMDDAAKGEDMQEMEGSDEDTDPSEAMAAMSDDDIKAEAEKRGMKVTPAKKASKKPAEKPDAEEHEQDDLDLAE